MTNAPGREAEGVAVSMYVPGGHAQTTAAPRQDAPAQLRRRRQASLRCEPLGDGRRDPWPGDRLREDHLQGHDAGDATSMSSRTLHVLVGKQTAWLHGRDGQDVFKLLDEVGVERRQWSSTERVWMIPVQYADDVMAWAEWKQRRTVTCEAVDR